MSSGVVAAAPASHLDGRGVRVTDLIKSIIALDITVVCVARSGRREVAIHSWHYAEGLIIKKSPTIGRVAVAAIHQPDGSVGGGGARPVGSGTGIIERVDSIAGLEMVFIYIARSESRSSTSHAHGGSKVNRVCTVTAMGYPTGDDVIRRVEVGGGIASIMGNMAVIKRQGSVRILVGAYARSTDITNDITSMPNVVTQSVCATTDVAIGRGNDCSFMTSKIGERRADNVVVPRQSKAGVEIADALTEAAMDAIVI